MITKVNVKSSLKGIMGAMLLLLVVGLFACEGRGNNRGSQEPDGEARNGEAITSPNANQYNDIYQGDFEETETRQSPFQTLDDDQDGYLNEVEWREIQRITPDDDRTFEEMDRNKDNRIDQAEYDASRDQGGIRQD